MNCSICLDDMDDNKIELKCGHIYHKKCINSWLKVSYNCPYCRATVKNSFKMRYGFFGYKIYINRDNIEFKRNGKVKKLYLLINIKSVEIVNMVSRKREIKLIIYIDGKLRDIIIRLNNQKDLFQCYELITSIMTC